MNSRSTRVVDVPSRRFRLEMRGCALRACAVVRKFVHFVSCIFMIQINKKPQHNMSIHNKCTPNTTQAVDVRVAMCICY